MSFRCYTSLKNEFDSVGKRECSIEIYFESNEFFEENCAGERLNLIPFRSKEIFNNYPLEFRDN